ncbi:MAG: dethiobiotin synthase [Desulfatitalea sp.]|nr:dethiobiotin synthase [Desulfatitalea sp.]NNK01176.1 dethiobiotin synthase [Desulfatitalea sp.]
MKRLKLPPRLFITGTGTGIGKTMMAAILMAGTRGLYWKPIQSGLDEMTDTEWIRDATGLPQHHFWPETYRLTQPLSPHAAARIDGIAIDLAAMTLPDPAPSGHLIVEGAGGIMVPLNDTAFMLDLIARLNLPTLVVASSQLGTINHTLLTLDQLKRHGIEITGVVLNGPQHDSNRHAIEYYGKTKVVAQIEPLAQVDVAALSRIFDANFTTGLPAA